MAVKILHTADWQIGKEFQELDEIDSDKAAALRRQRISTVAKIAAKAREHAVDAVVVAGDVFDSNDRSKVTDELLRRTLGAMEGYDGEWLLLPGNHDAAGQQSAWERLKQLNPPPNVKLLTTAEPQLIAEHRLAILPAPLLRRHEASDVTAALDHMQTPPDSVRVGVAHGSIRSQLPEGTKVHNEIAADRPERARLDYLALGDWHGTREISQRAWYAGTPEPDRFKENLPGNVLLVTIEGPGALPRVDRIPIGHYKWHDLVVELHSLTDLATLTAQLQGLGAPYDQHVVQLELRGTIDLETQQALANELRRWEARLHMLRCRTDGLLAQPSQADLQPMLDQGFVGAAVSRLRQLAEASEASDAERARARRALGLLYAEFVALAGGKKSGTPVLD
jgi:DNA repair exonuclease SbcCD nuclease subunit